MPYIQMRLSTELDNVQKNSLQQRITDIISVAFSKPKAYIMAEIETNCSLYMNEKETKGAYISISLLGRADKSVCSGATKQICDLLSGEYGIDSNTVYVTYHPTDLWGWNGMMF